MDVNFRAPLLLTHHLLPSLLAEPGSHLVNLSSLFGLIAPAASRRTRPASSRCAG
jgi:short-subunit dehydrogenase